MMDKEQDVPEPWPSAEAYGDRFDALNRRLEQSLASREYTGGSPEELGVLRYRLAKIAIAAEDIRRAIRLLERESIDDDTIANAVVELRNACTEVSESFAEVDSLLVRLLNYSS